MEIKVGKIKVEQQDIALCDPEEPFVCDCTCIASLRLC